MLKPPASLVLHTIENGCLPNASSGSAEQCLGQGVMPANVVQGRDAQNVADFVARVAGKRVAFGRPGLRGRARRTTVRARLCTDYRRP